MASDVDRTLHVSSEDIILKLINERRAGAIANEVIPMVSALRSTELKVKDLIDRIQGGDQSFDSISLA